MKIHREWLGGSEDIDLSTEEGYRFFADEIVMDEDIALQRIQRLRETLPGHDFLVNEGDEPQYIERYVLIEDGPVWVEPDFTDPPDDDSGISDAHLALNAAIWGYLDATGGDDSNLDDLVDQAVKAWTP